MSGGNEYRCNFLQIFCKKKTNVVGSHTCRFLIYLSEIFSILPYVVILLSPFYVKNLTTIVSYVRKIMPSSLRRTHGNRFVNISKTLDSNWKNARRAL